MEDSAIYGWTKAHLLEVLTGGKQPVLTNPDLITAFKLVDRAHFVDAKHLDSAYSDEDVDFKDGMENNSPVVVATMMQALDVKAGAKILELGTGSGYTLALLASAVGNEGFVYSLERDQQVLDIARKNLAHYPSLKNYEMIFKNASEGLWQRAPFSAIFSGFSMSEMPATILSQLSLGGRMVCPHTNSEIKIYTRINETQVQSQLLTVKKFSQMQAGLV